MARARWKEDLKGLRAAAAEDGDKRLLQMNDRELKAAALENYRDQADRETVIRTRAVDGGNR